MPPATPDRLRAAREEWSNVNAQRAVEDPAKLRKAMRVVRVALAREMITIDELVPDAGDQ